MVYTKQTEVTIRHYKKKYENWTKIHTKTTYLKI